MSIRRRIRFLMLPFRWIWLGLFDWDAAKVALCLAFLGRPTKAARRPSKRPSSPTREELATYSLVQECGTIYESVRSRWPYAHFCPEMDDLLILWNTGDCYCDYVPYGADR